MMNAFKKKYIFIENTEIKTIPPQKFHEGRKPILPAADLLEVRWNYA